MVSSGGARWDTLQNEAPSLAVPEQRETARCPASSARLRCSGVAGLASALAAGEGAEVVPPETHCHLLSLHTESCPTAGVCRGPALV